MVIKAILLGVMIVTSYRPIKSQTDDSPTWTSIGDRTTKFGAAASPDLLKSGRLHYGDHILIEGLGIRVINDCTNPRLHNTIDILVFTHAEEKKIGVRHLNVYKLEVYK